jgi:hypothetical protein
VFRVACIVLHTVACHASVVLTPQLIGAKFLLPKPLPLELLSLLPKLFNADPSTATWFTLHLYHFSSPHPSVDRENTIAKLPPSSYLSRYSQCLVDYVNAFHQSGATDAVLGRLRGPEGPSVRLSVEELLRFTEAWHGSANVLEPSFAAQYFGGDEGFFALLSLRVASLSDDEMRQYDTLKTVVNSLIKSGGTLVPKVLKRDDGHKFSEVTELKVACRLIERCACV